MQSVYNLLDPFGLCATSGGFPPHLRRVLQYTVHRFVARLAIMFLSDFVIDFHSLDIRFAVATHCGFLSVTDVYGVYYADDDDDDDADMPIERKLPPGCHYLNRREEKKGEKGGTLTFCQVDDRAHEICPRAHACSERRED